MRLKQIIA